MKLLPPWLAAFEREGQAAHIRFTELFTRLLRDSKSRKLYTDTTTVSEHLLKEQSELGLSDIEIAWIAGTIFGAGADTSMAALTVFVLAMVLHPEVMRKAQAEIDRVVGRDRLPTSADHEHLPYIGALVKETLRWKPVAPLAVPRRVMEDDIYEGYFIPRGSIIIPNVWAMCHDPELYHNPTQFKPERYLSEDGQQEFNPSGVRDEAHTFGFGRRYVSMLHPLQYLQSKSL